MRKPSRIALILVVLVLVTSCFVGSTFAKYTTAVTGTDAVTVAKWAFKQGDTNITESLSFDLFNTIKDSNKTDNETDVSEGKIAPGTSGSFAIVLENESEVTAMYQLAYTETDSGIPLQFSLDGTTWKESISDLNMEEAATMAIGADASTVTVHWQWIFGGDDTTDTNLGKAGTLPEYTVYVNCVFTQVD